MTPQPTQTDQRSRVLIAGGGVAGVEALLALRALTGQGPQIELVSPDPELVYRPQLVTEPFEVGEARRFALADIAADQHASFRSEALTAVDPQTATARVGSGESLPFDALLVATGSRPYHPLPGALAFRGQPGAEEVAGVLQAAEDGDLRRLVFAVPAAVSWTFPLYELALLTAWRFEERGIDGVELTLVTPEAEPLDLFGPRAAARVRTLLEERGIGLLTDSVPVEAGDGQLALSGAPGVPADQVITVPGQRGPGIPGLPADADGFIPADAHGRVRGLDSVYVAGDGGDFPVKQGGLATQQADAAAEAIAAALGVVDTPRPFRPVLRAALLTGSVPLYLRTHLGAGDVPAPEVGHRPLWWPPGKIAGRYLSPYLAKLERPSLESPTLEDREWTDEEPPVDLAEHEAVRDLALTMADNEAHKGSESRALEWLDAAEAASGVLPPEYVEKRRGWRLVRERAAARRRAELGP